MGTVQPLRRKVAIVGTAPSWIEAPFDSSEWEVWGLNGGWSVLPRWDRWFEMHAPDSIADTYGPGYIAFLGAALGPVYMQEPVDWVPASVRYPIEKMTEQFGEPWACTPAYMLALAIAEGFSEIGLFGIDLTGAEEYLAQREWVQYLVGVARGRGVRVTFPESGSWMESPGFRYGYEASRAVPDSVSEAAARELALALKHRDAATADMYRAEGARKAFTAIRRAKNDGLLTDAFVEAAIASVNDKLARAVAGRIEWEGVAKGAARIEGHIAHIAQRGAA